MSASALTRSTGLALLLCSACAAQPAAYQRDAFYDASAHGPAAAIRATDVCFTVHNPGDSVAAHVRGTRYQRADAPADARAILLLHGVVSTRAIWEGLAGTPSAARELAEAGYAVFAIDRLGYGESVYERDPGAGWTLTPESYAAMTLEVVTQLREGRYSIRQGRRAASIARAGTHRCLYARAAGQERPPRRGARRPQHRSRAGHPLCRRHRDIDALISIGWSNHGFGSVVGLILGTSVAPQLAEGRDYVRFFLPEGTGYSERCEQALFHVPGVARDVLQAACADGFFGTTPSGEVASLGGDVQAATLAAIPTLGPLPVLLVFAEQDNIFPPAGHGGLTGTDPDVVTPEIAYWTSQCGCDLGIVFQPPSGHANFFHHSASSWTSAMTSFLRARGL